MLKVATATLYKTNPDRHSHHEMAVGFLIAYLPRSLERSLQPTLALWRAARPQPRGIPRRCFQVLDIAPLRKKKAA